jgi:hypothetical protein
MVVAEEKRRAKKARWNPSRQSLEGRARGRKIDKREFYEDSHSVEYILNGHFELGKKWWKMGHEVSGTESRSDQLQTKPASISIGLVGVSVRITRLVDRDAGSTFHWHWVLLDGNIVEENRIARLREGWIGTNVSTYLFHLVLFCFFAKFDAQVFPETKTLTTHQ